MILRKKIPSKFVPLHLLSLFEIISVAVPHRSNFREKNCFCNNKSIGCRFLS